jgi:hypothetical protein
MGTVSGQVTDHTGRAVPGVWVYVYPADGARFGRSVGMHTNSDGRYSFELPAGAWKVREAGFGGHEVTVTDTPEPAEPADFTVGATVRRRHGGHLGTVTDVNDERVAVEFDRPNGGTFTAEVPTGRVGEALELVTPAGES